MTSREELIEPRSSWRGDPRPQRARSAQIHNPYIEQNSEGNDD